MQNSKVFWEIFFMQLTLHGEIVGDARCKKFGLALIGLNKISRNGRR